MQIKKNIKQERQNNQSLFCCRRILGWR